MYGPIDTPTAEELEAERCYLEAMDRIAEYDAWIELQAQLDDFTGWPLADLVEELEIVRTLTPDQADVIAELEAEIARRRAA